MVGVTVVGAIDGVFKCVGARDSVGAMIGETDTVGNVVGVSVGTEFKVFVGSLLG